MKNYTLYLMDYMGEYHKTAKGDSYEELKESITEAEKYFNSKGIEEFFCADIELEKEELTNYIYQESYCGILETIKEIEYHKIQHLEKEKILVGIKEGMNIESWEHDIIIYNEEKTINVFWERLIESGKSEKEVDEMATIFAWIPSENQPRFLKNYYGIEFFNKEHEPTFFYETF